jgi:3D (Asp-Asp-Asp) domain-containing protein
MKKLLIISIIILAVIFLTSMMKADDLELRNQELKLANSDLQVVLNEKDDEIIELSDTVRELEVVISNMETPTKLTLSASGYTTGEEGVNNITASGETVQEWCTVAMGSSFEFGTKVYIPYFDCVFTVQDRGGAISDGDIDIYFGTMDQCVEFGRRELEVYVLE